SGQRAATATGPPAGEHIPLTAWRRRAVGRKKAWLAQERLASKNDPDVHHTPGRPTMRNGARVRHQHPAPSRPWLHYICKHKSFSIKKNDLTRALPSPPSTYKRLMIQVGSQHPGISRRP